MGVMRANLREASKLLGGSALVYAVVAGVPSNESPQSTCESVSPVAALGSPVPLAKADTELSGSQLKANYLEGADGSRQFLGWRDAVNGIDCTYGLAADGSWRCLPAGPLAGTFFADAACTRPLVAIPKGCSAPKVALARGTSVCAVQQSTRVFAVGDRFSGPVAYWVVGGVCSGVSSGDIVLSDLYFLGDEVQATAFVQGTPQVEP